MVSDQRIVTLKQGLTVYNDFNLYFYDCINVFILELLASSC